MNSFDLLRPAKLDDALKALATGAPPVIKAGGIDLLDRMKEGIFAPAALLDVNRLDALRTIGVAKDEPELPPRLRIGATTTLAEVASSPDVRAKATALADAAGEAATPQIRNVATVGGNLLQSTRCWYYRTGDFEPCYKRGGGFCPAKDGRNKYNAVFGTDNACVCVNPSSLGPALVALDARYRVVSWDGKARAHKDATIDKVFSVGPDTDHTLEPGQVLQHVEIPLEPARRSAYRELNERASFDWALVSCAVSWVEKDGCQDPRIVLGAVAHRPLRRPEAEALLAGRKLTPDLAREVAAKAAEGARPLAENAYKVPIVKALVARALLAAAGLEEKK